MPQFQARDHLLIAQLTPMVLDEAEIGIIVVDEGGIIRYANRAIEDMTGLPLPGESVDRLVPPSSRVAHPALRGSFTGGAGSPIRWMGESQSNIRICNSMGEEIAVRIGLRRMMTDWGRFVFAYISRRPD